MSNKKSAVDGDPLYGTDAASLQASFRYHLCCDIGVSLEESRPRDRYRALALTMRDRIIPRMVATRERQDASHAKRVHYLSMEYLLGPALEANVINLGLQRVVQEAMTGLGVDWHEIVEETVDPGLGNGGLGRLAACFLESLATQDLPAIGYGLRYEHGIFQQQVENGYQLEAPDNWLEAGDPWEIERPEDAIPVHFGGRIVKCREAGRFVVRWIDTHEIRGIPYDRPVVGYDASTVNTLRLFRAAAAEEFDFDDFNQGDYWNAVQGKIEAENLTKVLYPDDSFPEGEALRLRQQYFFVACSIYDMLERFKRLGEPWDRLPDRAAVQLNDTHPALAVPELLRLLIDREGLVWEDAWALTRRTIAYTNHTLMPEALERWPLPLLERLLPRHVDLIYTINHAFMKEVAAKFPGDAGRLERMSLIEETRPQRVRMAHLSVVGSHTVNGVAELHTRLLRERVLTDFAEMHPERFQSKTNGVTPRRWLLKANPPLANLITEAIGDGWQRDLSRLEQLKPLADDRSFREQAAQAKREAKLRFADYARRQHGFELNPDAIFDVQAKRIHEYKRQLMNALHLVILYNRLRANPDADVVPRTFLFAGKAAPGYKLAKRIIKLINAIGEVVNRDPVVRDKLQVFFLPNHSVSLAEKLMPAADISEQISLAGTEASGTGNMKFMANGALTVGTMDGANIEIVDAVGEDNAFIFGMDADEVHALRGHYDAHHHYRHESETRGAIDAILGEVFSQNEPGIFEPIRHALFDANDRFMNLADLGAFADAQERAARLYRDQPATWTRMSVMNTACCGRFSSDRTIDEYARHIWGLAPCRDRAQQVSAK